MAGEITLPLDCSAEPDTCGSCKFFDRTMRDGPYEMSSGHCRFKLPPFEEKYRVLTYVETGESDRAANWIKDTHACDLYRPDGKVYIVQRRIPPERAG